MTGMSSEISDDDEAPKYKLCTFLFGNVDKRGKLEEEYAQDNELSSLNNLDNCHTEAEITVRSIVTEGNLAQDNDDQSPNAIQFSSPSAALDYYDETEFIKEPDDTHLDFSSVDNVLPNRISTEDEYDDDDVFTNLADTQQGEDHFHEKVEEPDIMKSHPDQTFLQYAQPSSPIPKELTFKRSPCSSPIRTISSTASPLPTNTQADSDDLHNELDNLLKPTPPYHDNADNDSSSPPTSNKVPEMARSPSPNNFPFLKHVSDEGTTFSYTHPSSSLSVGEDAEANEMTSSLSDYSSLNKPFSIKFESPVNESNESDLSSLLARQTIPLPDTSSIKVEYTNIESPDLATSMPPPLHPAPISASRCISQRNFCLDSENSPQPLSNNELFSPLPNTPSSQNGTLALTPTTLNTPLGNLLPAEYADLDITTLFPYYSPSATPRWSRLFRLPHPPMLYRNLSVGHSQDSDLKSHENRLHLIFRDHLDLGELPSSQKEFEQAKISDELEELERPPESELSFLAGHENSWWRRAFADRLSQLQKEEENKVAFKKNGSNNASKKAIGTGIDSTENSPLGIFASSKVKKYCSWRLGPAQYWYDQLNIPLTADITKWKRWNQTQLPEKFSNSGKNSTIDEQIASIPILKSGSISNTSNGVIRVGDRDAEKDENQPRNPRSVECSVANFPKQKHISSSACHLKSEQTFLPYQLMQWEDDIIYDAQLSSHKIAESARQNAAHAGWIPSQHCRTMAAFQDAYQGKYPGILGYKTLTGAGVSGSLIKNRAGFPNSDSMSAISKPGFGEKTSPNGLSRVGGGFAPNTPYAFFPIENKGILTDAWRWDIIYDPDIAAQTLPPFLLTFDRNDENCILDTVNDDEVPISIIPGSDAGYPCFGQPSLGLTNLMSTETGGVGENIESEQQKNALNRTSFHVSFGLASTRGMLTGALAKAEKGAEKVKRILGKHGLLAEGDHWHSEDGEDVGLDGAVVETSFSSAAAAASGIPPKDPLNISNDEFYAMRSGGLFGCLARCGPLQHSTPAVELWPPFFPTYNKPSRLRMFHREPLKRYTSGLLSQYNTPIPLTNLTKLVQKKMKEREDEKAASGGGDIFFMRTPADLTGCDGEILLFEYSEEYPPLMAQVGMATRMVNYYRPLQPRDPSLSPDPAGYDCPPSLPYGSLVYVGSTDSPFLGVIRPGGCLQSLENNLFRALVYPHKTPSTDFLVVRNRYSMWIRRAPVAFTVGQEVPLMEVPGPNSKRANNFARDFLQVYILRLFLRSTDEPKRIKMEEIRSAFPNHSESSVRKRLKICADFKRTGIDAGWWVLREDYRLPSEEEIRYLVQPEDFCAYLSMQAAELRLKDAGYGEKSLFVLDENQEDEEDREGQPKMEDEVRAAPWNTTRAYLAAQRGGCFLELHGPADPTGCGEAFSYSKTSAKPGALFRQAGGEVARGLLKDKRTVTGTDADLRKLHLREARALLRSFGISEADLKTFKRWEIIDMVRFTSTERAKQGEEESTAKFARGNRLSMLEQIRCYREECQRIFDLQNRVLSNTELLSSDDEEEPSSDDDEEEEVFMTGKSTTGLPSHHSASGGVGVGNAIGGVRLSSLPSNRHSYDTASRNIESLLVNRITSEELKERQEEVDREDLKRSVELGKSLSHLSRRNKRTNSLTTGSAELSSVAASSSTKINMLPSVTFYEANAMSAGEILDLPPPFPGAQKKMLRIVRTYSSDGQQYTRTERVPWSLVVEIYLKIRQTRDQDSIHKFVGSDDLQRDHDRKEKRRLQDQLRRLRKQRSRALSGGLSRDSSGRLIGANRVGVAARRRHKPLNPTLKMRCGACGQTGHMRTNKECPMYGRSDVLPHIPINERRAVGQSRSLTSSRLYDLAGVEPEAVAAAKELISKPVAELLAESAWAEIESSVRESGADGDILDAGGDGPCSIGVPSRYSRHSSVDYVKSEDERHRFPSEVEENASTVEGTKLRLHSKLLRCIEAQKRRDLKMTINRPLLDKLNQAKGMVALVAANRRRLAASRLQRGKRRLYGSLASAGDDDYPTSTVKNRGNRRRIDPRVALNHIFEGIYKGLSQVAGYKIFTQPVKEREFPNYYSKIKNPMDLSHIRMKINGNIYSTREEFLTDIRLIHDNSLNYNGPHSAYTETAMKMCSYVMEEFCHKELKLMRLESLVNPLLDENDLVSLSFLLQKAVEAMRGVENSRAFHFPVDKRRYPDYYKAISHPMDLTTLEGRVKENKYHSRDEFFADADLLLSNCIAYNGTDSVLTKIAEKMLKVGRGTLEESAETIESIEDSIRRCQEDVSIADSHSQHEFSLMSVESTSKASTYLSSPKQPPEDNITPTSSLKSSFFETKQHSPPSTSTSVARSGRHCSTGAWYGADLFSDEDEEFSKNRNISLKRQHEVSSNDEDDTISHFVTTDLKPLQVMTKRCKESSSADDSLFGLKLSSSATCLLRRTSDQTFPSYDIGLSGTPWSADNLPLSESAHLRDSQSSPDRSMGSRVPVMDAASELLIGDSTDTTLFTKGLPETIVAQDLLLTDSDCSDTISDPGGELCEEKNMKNSINRLDFEISLDTLPQSRVEFFIGSDDDESKPENSPNFHGESC